MLVAENLYNLGKYKEENNIPSKKRAMVSILGYFFFFMCVSCSVMSDSLQPMGYSPAASSVMEFSRQEYWSGLSFPSPGDFLDPGIELGSPALQADSLPSEL